MCGHRITQTGRTTSKSFPLQVLFGTAGPGVNLSQADFFATAAIAPRESEAFFARMRELLADPAQIDESEWELATEPPRILQRYSAPMRSMVGLRDADEYAGSKPQGSDLGPRPCYSSLTVGPGPPAWPMAPPSPWA